MMDDTEIPKMLLHIESLLKEHVRDYLLCCNMPDENGELKTYSFMSSKVSGMGFANLAIEDILQSWNSNHIDDHE